MKLRRMVLGLLALVGVGVLIACTTSTKTADYQRLVEGQMDIRNHFEYRGDKITLMETTTTIIYSAYGLTGDSVAAIQAYVGNAAWAWLIFSMIVLMIIHFIKGVLKFLFVLALVLIGRIS